MATNVTVCGLNNVPIGPSGFGGEVNINGVYTIASLVNGKVSFERTVDWTVVYEDVTISDSTTFSLQYFESGPTQEWHIVNKNKTGTWLAVGGAEDDKLPWESTWVNNGYGIADVTEGIAVCSTCDPRFDMHAYGDECGEDRFRRLRLLGYL